MTDTFTPPPTKWSSRIAALIFLGVLAALGWAFTSEGVRYLDVAYGAPSYVAQKGKITKATLRTEANNQVPEITFEYEVGGKTYEGTNRYGANAYKDAKLARIELQRYKVGAAKTVYVNPDDPAQASLTQDVSKIPGLMRLGYGVLAFGAMIFCMVVFRRVIKRKRALARTKHILAQARSRD